MVSTSETSPENPKENSENQDLNVGDGGDAKGIDEALTKIFGSPDIKQWDDTPLPYDKKREMVERIKVNGITHPNYNSKREIIGFTTLYPLSDKPPEIY